MVSGGYAGKPRLIRNADLVMTMEPERGTGALGLIANGDVLLADDRIVAVGQGLDSPAPCALHPPVSISHREVDSVGFIVTGQQRQTDGSRQRQFSCRHIQNSAS
jgi:hypothetical protein